jgi:hypothetical protein
MGPVPPIEARLRALIRQMSMNNPLWGAPRIHGELLKLGFEVAQSSVAKYMVKRRGPPGQGWLTFLTHSCSRYCRHVRTHRSLDKDAPVSRPVQRTGSIKSLPILGLESMGEGIGGHAPAGVAYRDRHVLTRRDLRVRPAIFVVEDLVKSI